ncbi:hypothetical protein D3C71_1760880 [compost metagenome]
MKLQADSTSFNLFRQRLQEGRISFAGKAQIHRKRFGSLQHPLHMPSPRCACGGIRSRCWPRATADHRRYARGKRGFNLLRTNKMDMRIDTASRYDFAFTRNDLCARTYN